MTTAEAATQDVSMNPLLLPYILNIIILVPIANMMLWGGERGGQAACEGKFPESEGFRTILGALWSAILFGSILGLFWPVAMAPLLLIQVLYKGLWLTTYVVPRLIRGRHDDIPMGISASFAVIVLSYPWVIPWRAVFGG